MDIFVIVHSNFTSSEPFVAAYKSKQVAIDTAKAIATELFPGKDLEWSSDTSFRVSGENEFYNVKKTFLQ